MVHPVDWKLFKMIFADLQISHISGYLQVYSTNCRPAHSPISERNIKRPGSVLKSTKVGDDRNLSLLKKNPSQHQVKLRVLWRHSIEKILTQETPSCGEECGKPACPWCRRWDQVGKRCWWGRLLWLPLWWTYKVIDWRTWRRKSRKDHRVKGPYLGLCDHRGQWWSRSRRSSCGVKVCGMEEHAGSMFGELVQLEVWFETKSSIVDCRIDSIVHTAMCAQFCSFKQTSRREASKRNDGEWGMKSKKQSRRQEALVKIHTPTLSQQWNSRWTPTGEFLIKNTYIAMNNPATGWVKSQSVYFGPDDRGWVVQLDEWQVQVQGED